MSIVNEDYKSKCDDNGKNKSKICCQLCPSVMLNPGAAIHQALEFDLPLFQRNKEDKTDQVERIGHFWFVEDMFTFENVGVSNIANNVKYLVCADCEKGPIGYMNIATKKSWVALSRVAYQEQ